MSAIDSGPHAVTGRTDAAGRLIEADGRLIDLVSRAGGGLNAVIAVPEIAGLERLARRLGIAVARTVVVADGDEDVELRIRAEPSGDGVALEIAGWQPRAAWRNTVAVERRESDFVRAEADWLWDADAALHLTHISLDAGIRYGFDAAAMLGQPLMKLFALVEDTGGGFPILSAVAGRMRFDGQEAELRGTSHRVRLSADPRTDERGRFAGFAGAVEMLDADGRDGAHDLVFPNGFGVRLDRSLRAPLQRIVANAGSMSAGVEGPLAPNYAGYANDIADAGRHLLGLVDDLVDLEAIEREDFALDAEPIDLVDIARRAAGLLSVRAADGDVRVDCPAADDALLATGEFRRALQVMVNLVGNAIRYSPRGGLVMVGAERDGTRARLIVADQGKGIVEADQSLIFEKFGRVDPTEPGGSGLGLYISRRLARAMGGDIDVESAAGQGARFVFTLPGAAAGRP